MESRQLFRLCHVCAAVNESNNESDVSKCLRCGKSFLPVNYFEKLRTRALQTEKNQVEVPQILFSPIHGLIVFW
ncbi:MAG: hypothetical protein AB1540_09205 [Bdellovibrionota bacterium]